MFRPDEHELLTPLQILNNNVTYMPCSAILRDLQWLLLNFGRRKSDGTARLLSAECLQTATSFIGYILFYARYVGSFEEGINDLDHLKYIKLDTTNMLRVLRSYSESPNEVEHVYQLFDVVIGDLVSLCDSNRENLFRDMGPEVYQCTMTMNTLHAATRGLDYIGCELEVRLFRDWLIQVNDVGADPFDLLNEFELATLLNSMLVFTRNISSNNDILYPLDALPSDDWNDMISEVDRLMVFFMNVTRLSHDYFTFPQQIADYIISYIKRIEFQQAPAPYMDIMAFPPMEGSQSWPLWQKLRTVNSLQTLLDECPCTECCVCLNYIFKQGVNFAILSACRHLLCVNCATTAFAFDSRCPYCRDTVKSWTTRELAQPVVEGEQQAPQHLELVN